MFYILHIAYADSWAWLGVVHNNIPCRLGFRKPQANSCILVLWRLWSLGPQPTYFLLCVILYPLLFCAVSIYKDIIKYKSKYHFFWIRLSSVKLYFRVLPYQLTYLICGIYRDPINWAAEVSLWSTWEKIIVHLLRIFTKQGMLIVGPIMYTLQYRIVLLLYHSSSCLEHIIFIISYNVLVFEQWFHCDYHDANDMILKDMGKIER